MTTSHLKTITVYVTKHALTQGILELEVYDCGDGMVKTIDTYPRYFHSEGNDWHRQEWQAIAHANTMRNKKIAQLTKSLRKLEKLSFHVKKEAK